MTKHIKGLEKALDVKWKLDKLCGMGFEKAKPKSLFEDEEREDKKENCLGKFKSKLVHYLSQERTNNELYIFTLTNGFLVKHANAILKDLRESNKLIFDRKVRKNAFYLSYDYYKKNTVKYKAKINE